MPTINGTAGDDLLFPSGSQDTAINGFSGNDTLIASFHDIILNGGAGNDILFPLYGNATLDGGTGVDWAGFDSTVDQLPAFVNGVTASLTTNSGNASVDADTYFFFFENIQNLQGSEFSDNLIGDANNNSLSGLRGDDVLLGLNGNDDIYPATGNDTIDGGFGTDRLILDFGDFDSGVEIDVTAGEVRGSASAQSFVQSFQNMEAYVGTRFSDLIVGGADGESLFGADGNDTIKGGGGDDEVLGGAGTDIALYDGSSSHFTIQHSFTDNNTYIVDRSGAEGTDTGSTNILRFADRDLNIVADGDQGFEGAVLSQTDFTALVELYIAYFNRAPDAGGLNFWATAFLNGTNLDQAAEFFFDQPETRALYGEQLNTSVFVTSVYQNVLGRGADDVGQTFWENALGNGSVTEGQFIRDFLQGARAEPPADASAAFINQQNADRAYLDTKTDIGVYFSTILGMSDVANANDVMSTFDGTAQSLISAQQKADDAYQAAIATDGTGELLIQLVGLVDNPFE